MTGLSVMLVCTLMSLVSGLIVMAMNGGAAFTGSVRGGIGSGIARTHLGHGFIWGAGVGGL